MGRIRDRAARSVYRILPLLHPAEPIAVHYRIGVAHVYQVIYVWTALKKCEEFVSTGVVKSSLQCSKKLPMGMSLFVIVWRLL